MLVKIILFVIEGVQKYFTANGRQAQTSSEISNLKVSFINKEAGRQANMLWPVLVVAVKCMRLKQPKQNHFAD